jgi:hypothetical protein
VQGTSSNNKRPRAAEANQDERFQAAKRQHIELITKLEHHAKEFREFAIEFHYLGYALEALEAEFQLQLTAKLAEKERRRWAKEVAAHEAKEAKEEELSSEASSSVSSSSSALLPSAPPAALPFSPLEPLPLVNELKERLHPPCVGPVEAAPQPARRPVLPARRRRRQPPLREVKKWVPKTKEEKAEVKEREEEKAFFQKLRAQVSSSSSSSDTETE